MRLVSLFAAFALLAPALGANALAAAAPRAAAPVRALAPGALHGSYAGRLAPGTPVSLYITLQGRNDAEIDRTIAAQNAPGSPAYLHYLTPEQYGHYFGASESDYAQALALLRRSGFTIDHLSRNHTDLEVHAPASVVESFFATPIDVRVEGTRVFFTNRYVARFPAALHAVGVVGLENYARWHAHSGRASAAQPQSKIGKLVGWGPPDIRSAYGLNPIYAKYDGSGYRVIDATYEKVRKPDFDAFSAQFGLHATLKQDVENGTPVDQYGESTLDVEWMAAIAPGEEVHLVSPNANTNRGFIWMYDHIVNDLYRERIVSTSWGQCEQSLGFDGYLASSEHLFKEAQLEGQWWMSAAGDWGTDDCEVKSRGPIAVDYPGSSQYVMSVGGTRVVPARKFDGRYNGWKDELVWNSSGCGASGGGQSVLFVRPAFQRGLVKSYMRQVPDVALMADGCWLGGYFIYYKGGWQNFWYGTSFAAPQWGAFLTLIEGKYGKTPIASPLYRLYDLASTPAYSKLFHNILHGCNGWDGVPGYCAGAGFSETSGLGSFIGAPLLRAY